MTNSFLKTIEKYHSAGFPIIPLSDKTPTGLAWQNTTLEQSKDFLVQGVFEKVQSAGFVIPEDIIVIDVDNHESTQGQISLDKLTEYYSFDFMLHAAVIVKTANEGLHLYFKKKPQFQKLSLANCLKNFPSVEFKTSKRQIVIPESKLNNGKKYEIHYLTSGFKNLTYLPDSLMQDLVRKENKVKTNVAQVQVADNADQAADIHYFKELINIQDVSLTGDRGNNLYQLACMGKERNLSQAKLLELLDDYNQIKNIPPLPQERFVHTIKSAFKYSRNKEATKSIALAFPKESNDKILTKQESKVQEDNLFSWEDKLIRNGKNQDGPISKTMFGTQNTELFIENLPELKGRLAINLFNLDTVWKKPAPWHKISNKDDDLEQSFNDDDVIRIRQIINKAGFDPSTQQIIEASRAVSFKNEFHPIKDYFESLAPWDGVKRLRRFFPDYCKSQDNKYSQDLGIKIFTAIVSRIYNVGCKFDYLPILVGKQGLQKSSLLKTLAIKDKWFTDSLGDVTHKDVILRMRSKLIIENPELTFKNANVDQIKAFLSREVDRDRLPYDRLPRDIPRQCIIIATTNKNKFLEDETGERRMWPIEVFNINLPKVKQDLDMFYAEALVRYKNNEPLYLEDQDSIKLAEAQQAEYYNEDEWQQTIQDFLNKHDLNKVTIGTIWSECFIRNISSLRMKDQKRIANILTVLKWKRAVYRQDGKVIRGFVK